MGQIAGRLAVDTGGIAPNVVRPTPDRRLRGRSTGQLEHRNPKRPNTQVGPATESQPKQPLPNGRGCFFAIHCQIGRGGIKPACRECGGEVATQPQNVHLQRPPNHLQTHPTRYAPRLLRRSRPQRRTQRPARVRRVSHGRTEPDPARDNSHPAPLRLPAY
jgi:hypothetical protein